MKTLNAVVQKNVTGLFREKTTDSEQVTQAIMGQPLHIEKDEGDWLYVETWDTYHGWIMSRNVSRNVARSAWTVTVTSLFTDALRAPNVYSDILTKLVITTELELLERTRDLKQVSRRRWALEFKEERGDVVHVGLPDGNEAWLHSGDVKIASKGDEELPLGATGDELVKTAKRFLGVPYLWGGTSPFGIDCSGFMQLVYKLNGVMLLRDANMQAEDPTAIPVERSEIAAGHMIFFAGGQDKTKITHVGMACGDGTFVHSAGQGRGVTINNLTDEPYNANYWGARRMP